MMTVFELNKPIGTARTHKRCKQNLEEALGQVEQLLRRGWHRANLENHVNWQHSSDRCSRAISRARCDDQRRTPSLHANAKLFLPCPSFAPN